MWERNFAVLQGMRAPGTQFSTSYVYNIRDYICKIDPIILLLISCLEYSLVGHREPLDLSESLHHSAPARCKLPKATPIPLRAPVQNPTITWNGAVWTACVELVPPAFRTRWSMVGLSSMQSQAGPQTSNSKGRPAPRDRLKTTACLSSTYSVHDP